MYCPLSGDSGSARILSTCLRTRASRTASRWSSGTSPSAAAAEREKAPPNTAIAFTSWRSAGSSASRRAASSELRLAGTLRSPSSPLSVQTPVALLQCAAVGERADRLDRVQRYALGALDDLPAHPLGQVHGELVEQLAHATVLERLELQQRGAAAPCRPRPALARRGEIRPREREHEDRAGGRPVQQMLDEVEQALVRPLQVLEHQDHR